MKVLFIDDEPECIILGGRALRKNLPKEDIQIEPAKDCNEALTKLESETFDVAILDQRLPRISGLDCLRRIRDRWKALPVVMLTGHGNDTGLHKESFKAYVDDYVSKDVLGAVFAHTVWAAIERRNGWVNASLNAQARSDRVDHMGIQNPALRQHLQENSELYKELEERIIVAETNAEKNYKLLAGAGGVIERLNDRTWWRGFLEKLLLAILASITTLIVAYLTKAH